MRAETGAKSSIALGKCQSGPSPGPPGGRVDKSKLKSLGNQVLVVLLVLGSHQLSHNYMYHRSRIRWTSCTYTWVWVRKPFSVFARNPLTLGIFMHGCWAGRESTIFGVGAAPAAQKTIP